MFCICSVFSICAVTKVTGTNGMVEYFDKYIDILDGKYYYRYICKNDLQKIPTKQHESSYLSTE